MKNYKLKHKEKISTCACGEKSYSGIFLGETISKIKGTASKCSSSNSNPPSSFTDSSSISSSISNSSSNYNSNYNTITNSNLSSGFTDPNSDSISNGETWSKTNLQTDSIHVKPSGSDDPIPSSSSSFKPSSSSGPTSSPGSTSNSNPTSSFSNIKFDITNKVSKKCNVIKQITCFDKKRSKYVKNAIQLRLSANFVILLLALAG